MAKIAILYEALGRSRGGIEAWIYHACEELVRQGHEVTVYNAQDQTPEDAVPPGVKIVTLRQPRHVPAFEHWVRAESFRSQLKQILGDYDAVWTRSFVLAWAAGKILGQRKTVYINAAPFPLYGRVSFREKLKNASGLGQILRVFVSEVSLGCAWVLEKNAIRHCTNVYLSAARRDETLSYYKLDNDPSYCFVIPAGVNTERFFPAETGWNGQKVLQLISVCRLAPDKNIQCIIQAVSELIKNEVPVSLTLVGEGKYETALRTLVQELSMEEHIHFVGRREDVQEWYRKSHVFVLPSLYEGFGSVYIEAMASGLPCIAVSAASGKYSVAADEIIDHGVNGFLMKNNDSAELAEYLSGLYHHPDEWDACSKSARAKAESKYCWKSVVLELLQISIGKHMKRQ